MYVFPSVGVHIASISHIIPSTEINTGTYAGTTPVKPKFTQASAIDESREDEAETQARDAELRKVVWDAEPQTEESPTCDLGKGIGEASFEYSGAPMGIRGDDGSILPLETQDTGADKDQMYSGVEEAIPANVRVAVSFTAGLLMYRLYRYAFRLLESIRSYAGCSGRLDSSYRDAAC